LMTMSISCAPTRMDSRAFERLGRGGGGAEGEAHDGDRFDGAALEEVGDHSYVGRIDADGSKIILASFLANALDFFFGRVGLEKRVVDFLGKLLVAL